MSLYDEAFIEANKLREAARSQAQTDIIEKYADEIKSNMDELLEQKEIDLGFGLEEQEEDEIGFAPPDEEGFEDDLGGMDDFDFEDDLEITDPGDTSYLDDQVPHAYSEGEKLCDCPEDDEEIEINFDDLMAADDEEVMEPGVTFDDEEELGDMMGDEEEEFLEEFEIDETLFEEFLADEELEEVVGRGMSREDVNDEGVATFDDGAEEGPESDTFYRYANDPLAEELTADVEEQPSGWSPRTDADFDDEFDKLLSRLSNPGEDKDKEVEKVKDAHSSPGDRRKKNDVNDRLKENFEHTYQQNKKLKKNLLNIKKKSVALVKENRNLEKKATNYRDRLLETADLLEALNLENTKLGLQKKVFENNSLNERQKNRLVEAISDARTPDEAKRIFKLQGSVGPNKKKGQNPLTEALRNKPTASSVLQNSRRAREEHEQEMLDEDTKSKWQKIAKII